MKTKILKLRTIFLLLLFIRASCQKDEIEYADESIIVNNHPGFFLFKTKVDYSDKIWVQVNSNDELTQIPILTHDSQHYNIDNKGNVKRTNWYILKNGYIIGPANERAVFTNISLTEYLNFNVINNINHWPDNKIKPRIIDEDPYLELYFMGCLDCEFREFSLREINKMIENGILEAVCTKIK